MKTNQFKHHLSELSFTYETFKDFGKEYLHIYTFNHHCVAIITITEMYKFNTLGKYYGELSKDDQDSLFNLLVEFSATPIKDRKDSIYQLTIYLNIGNSISFKSPTNFNFELIYNWFYMTSSPDSITPIFTNEIVSTNKIYLNRSTIQSMTLEEL